MHSPSAPAQSNPAAEASPFGGSRLASAVVLLASVAVLLVAAGLTPKSGGIGTHTALGLPACGLYQNTGIPCATCGMTTAFSFAAHGDLLASFLVQPAGAVLAVLTAMTAVISGYALATGMSLAPILKLVWRPRGVIAFAALLILGWVYKIVILTGLMG